MTSERTCHFTGDDAWKCGTSCTCQHFNWNNKGQAAELAKYKALAEELAGALELADCTLSGANMNMNVIERKVREALRQYKEARDD